MFTTIGELLVKIIGSETGLTSSINNAEKSVKKLGTTTETTAKSSGFQSIFQGVGLGVGLFAMNAVSGAIGDVTGAISDSITIAQDDQAAMTKLTQAMHDTGIAGDGMAQSLEDARQSGINLGFTYQQLTDAQALLVTGTKSVSNANIALTAAEDLARLKGIDLGTAVTAVNKLFNGSATAITRMGIAIPKGAKGLEAIADLEKAAGGQADAFAGTTAGAMDRANASINKLEGDLGSALLPILGTVADKLSDVINATTAATTAVDQNEQNLTTYLQGATEAQKQSAQAALQTAQNQVQGYQNIVTAATAGLPGGGFISQFLFGAAGGDAAKAGLQAQMDQVNTALGSGVESIQERGIEMHRAAVTTVASVVDAYQGLDGITPAAQKAMASVTSIIDKTPQDIAAGLQSGQSAVDSAMTNLINSVNHPMSEAARLAKLKGQLTTANYDLGVAEAAHDPVAIANAHAAIATVEGQMQLLQDAAPGYGLNTIAGYANAMGGAQALADVKRAAQAAAKAAKGILMAFSPPGPESPLHDIDKWGYNTGSAWADGLAMGLGTADPSGALSGIGIPGAAGSGAMGAVGSPLSGATIVVQVGNEKLAEITDRQLFQQGRIYAPGIPSQTLGAPTR